MLAALINLKGFDPQTKKKEAKQTDSFGIAIAIAILPMFHKSETSISSFFRIIEAPQQSY